MVAQLRLFDDTKIFSVAVVGVGASGCTFPPVTSNPLSTTPGNYAGASLTTMAMKHEAQADLDWW